MKTVAIMTKVEIPIVTGKWLYENTINYWNKDGQLCIEPRTPESEERARLAEEIDNAKL